MRFQYQNASVLEVGASYTAKITNATILNEDKDSERILINVAVDGYIAPSPASFATGTDTGCNMLNALMNSLGVKTLAELTGKTVKVKLTPSKVEGYVNTTLYAPTAVINTAVTAEAVAPEEAVAALEELAL